MKSTILLYINGLVDLFFVDESGFSLSPNGFYAWQKIGEQMGIPSSSKNVQNVLGFLSPIDAHLITYTLPEKAYMNSELFIEYIENFISKRSKETALVIDRAPWHTSWAVLDKIVEWENRGLHLIYLPPYSPHLNLIETLWRKIKNEWLKIKDYKSKAALKRKLKEIFTSFGKTYSIKFSMNIFTDK